MNIKITTVGVLNRILPSSIEFTEGKVLTVQAMLDALVNKYGNRVTEELFRDGKFKKELSLLINGRNILSITNKFQTLLKDKDEIMITTYIAGG